MRSTTSVSLIYLICLVNAVFSSLTYLIPQTAICKYIQEFGNTHYCDCASSGPCTNVNSIGQSSCCDLGDLPTGCGNNEVLESFSAQEVYITGDCGEDLTCGMRRQLYQYLCCRCPAGYISTSTTIGSGSPSCNNMPVTCAGCSDTDEELVSAGGVLSCKKRMLSSSVANVPSPTPSSSPSTMTVRISTTTTSKSRTSTKTTTTKKRTTTSTTTSCPTHATSIPGPPADPPKPVVGDGSGAWNSRKPTIADHAEMLKFRAMARAADALGLHHAASNLDHYLDDKGTTWTNKPEDMMKDIPSFKAAVRALLSQQAGKAFNSAKAGKGSSKTFQSKWNGFYATKTLSQDWFFAIGGFSYAVAGSVTTCKTATSWVGTLSYKVYIFDRYNWDGGKSVTIGPFVFTDKELGHMHTVGLAREYIVRGSSGVSTIENWNGLSIPTTR